jgi:hypothetical protein
MCLLTCSRAVENGLVYYTSYFAFHKPPVWGVSDEEDSALALHGNHCLAFGGGLDREYSMT